MEGFPSRFFQAKRHPHWSLGKSRKPRAESAFPDSGKKKWLSTEKKVNAAQDWRVKFNPHQSTRRVKKTPTDELLRRRHTFVGGWFVFQRISSKRRKNRMCGVTS